MEDLERGWRKKKKRIYVKEKERKLKSRNDKSEVKSIILILEMKQRVL